MGFYLTTAIDYVNSRPHLGTAYEKVTADVIVRYRRMCGIPTWFVMGNDEHSQNVYQRAAERGLDPIAFCDEMEQVFRETWAKLDVSFDDFIRTTEDRHRVAVTTLVQRIADAGDLYEGEYEGWYCVSCEAFKQDKDLLDGYCQVHPTQKPDWIKEKNHFFRLSRYRDPLLAHYRAHPEFLQPEVRRNEMLRLLEGGLEDISVSRTGQSWGIPLPFDPSSVVYVWFDALINYIAAIGYGTDEALFERWWPAQLHVVGKDITRFHTVVWPAMLMSAGVPLPAQVFGHGWVHWQGQKMSKSLGMSVDPLEAAERLGPDPLRLYLTKEITFGQDGDFSWERFEEQYNVDLANNLGNLVNRVAVMAHKYRDGQLSAPEGGASSLEIRAAEVVSRYRAAMDEHRLHAGMTLAFDLVDATNEYITRSEPWALAKDPAQAEALDRVLFDAAESIRVSAVLLWPAIPSSATEILRRMGHDGPPTDLSVEAAWSNRPRSLVKGPPLWPRIERADAEPDGATRERKTAAKGTETKMTDELDPPALPAPPVAMPTPAAEKPAPLPVEEAPRVSFDDFLKVELRVARVTSAEAIPKSKKLLKVTVEVGGAERTLVAGIARAYEPESLVGRSVVIVANLEKAKLMGVDSNGMMLAATDPEGKPVLLTVDDPEAAPSGARVR
ncbi:MAG: methionine--tRNA ligase [Acidobacteria bacterium]|nr:methionine--tRNA ligase [Acidobacteriota bacterium]